MNYYVILTRPKGAKTWISLGMVGVLTNKRMAVQDARLFVRPGWEWSVRLVGDEVAGGEAPD